MQNKPYDQVAPNFFDVLFVHADFKVTKIIDVRFFAILTLYFMLCLPVFQHGTL